MQQKAWAAVFEGPHKRFSLREFDVCSAPQGMAGLRLIASGICGTDVHIKNGKIPVSFPSIIGHEFVGQIEEISPEDAGRSGLTSGDRVISVIACPCGECPLCRQGDDANCVRMGVTNAGDPDVAPHFFGGFAEYNFSPVKNLVKIPAETDAAAAAVFACAGPTAIHTFSLARQAGFVLCEASAAVVQGIGPVGLFALMYLASAGIKNIIALTIRENPAKRALALALGASRVLSYEKDGADAVAQTIQEVSAGLGADLVYEASGNPDAFAQGLGMLRNRGLYLVPGQYSNGRNVEIAPQTITFKALRIIGSSQYSIRDVREYLSFFTKRRGLEAAIRSAASCYTVRQINDAFDDMDAGLTVKCLLVPSPGGGQT